jgi:Tol biopolymer transport system component
MALAPNTRLGPYEITSQIGAGGMGEVYRARDSKLKREVALKVLPADVAADRERLARFQREAEVLASLNHPNIAHIHGLEESNGTTALVMELVEGDDLAQRLTRGAIPIDEALAIARQIAEALEAAHEQGIIHRDLKPANIKVKDDGTVKVLDFGLAKALDPGAGNREPGAGHTLANSPTITSPAMTMRGVILGTAAYMAPEQAKGKTVDRRADIWAFGCVLYEMLTGRRAFQGDDVTDIITSVMRDTPDASALPASTPSPIRVLLQRCLEKDPRKRAPHMSIARLAIEDAAMPAATMLPAAHGAPRRAVPVTAIAVVVIALAAVGAFVAERWLSPPPRPLPITFHVDSAGDTRFSQRLTNFLSVSPDGRQLAYVARGAREDESLWIHSFETGEARAIPNTQGAGMPFWSPDSRSVAFRLGAGLRRVDLTSGATQSLCECIGTGGTWNADGLVLFANGGIMSVPASGGTPQTVTTIDESGDEIRHIGPHFLPDGRHFLFTAVHRDVSKSILRIGEIGSNETRPLAAISSGVYYVEPGYLFYAEDARLLARGFDATSLQWTGEPTVVANTVRQLSAGPAAFGASRNGVIAFDPNNLFRQDAEALWLDRKGNEVGRLADFSSVHAFALSPDEKVLAIEQNALSIGNNVWIIDGARGTRTRLSFERGTQGHPVFSPDGSRVAYFVGQPGALTSLHIKAANGAREPEPVTAANAAATGTLQPTDWSRDGRYLIYEEQDLKARHYDLKVVDLLGTQPPVTVVGSPFQERLGQLSPDGRWLAYQSDESGTEEIYVVSFPDRLHRVMVSSRGGQKPRWGKGELLFINGDGMLTAVSVKDGAALEVGAPTTLFALNSISTDGYNYAVSRDGSRFLVARPAASGPKLRVTVIVNWPSTQAK